MKDKELAMLRNALPAIIWELRNEYITRVQLANGEQGLSAGWKITVDLITGGLWI